MELLIVPENKNKKCSRTYRNVSHTHTHTKGASLKDLPLAKFGIILAPKRRVNVTDNTTLNNLSPE